MSDDRDREIADLRDRLARLEAQAAPPRNPPALTPALARPAGNGCLGFAVFAVTCVIVVLVVAHLPGPTANTPTRTDPDHYIGSCAAALVHAQRVAPELRGIRVAPTSPVVLTPGQLPVRVECALASDEHTGQLNILVDCDNALEASCQTMERAWVDGRLIYPAR